VEPQAKPEKEGQRERERERERERSAHRKNGASTSTIKGTEQRSNNATTQWKKNYGEAAQSEEGTDFRLYIYIYIYIHTYVPTYIHTYTLKQIYDTHTYIYIYFRSVIYTHSDKSSLSFSLSLSLSLSLSPLEENPSQAGRILKEKAVPLRSMYYVP
jgi:hypothetical protein